MDNNAHNNSTHHEIRNLAIAFGIVLAISLSRGITKLKLNKEQKEALKNGKISIETINEKFNYYNSNLLSIYNPNTKEYALIERIDEKKDTYYDLVLGKNVDINYYLNNEFYKVDVEELIKKVKISDASNKEINNMNLIEYYLFTRSNGKIEYAAIKGTDLAKKVEAFWNKTYGTSIPYNPVKKHDIYKSKVIYVDSDGNRNTKEINDSTLALYNYENDDLVVFFDYNQEETDLSNYENYSRIDLYSIIDNNPFNIINGQINIDINNLKDIIKNYYENTEIKKM